MDPLREWLDRIRGLWRPTRSDADLEAELRSHLEFSRAARDAERQGEPAVAGAMESLRDQRGVPSLDSLFRDVRQAARGLRRTPTFALVAIATLSLAIAAATAVFTIVDTVLLEPLPYPAPDRLIAIWQTAPGAPGLASVSGDLRLSDSMYFTYAEQNRVFDALGVWDVEPLTVRTSGDPEQVRAGLVSDGVLQALAVAPLLGRSLDAGDQNLGSPQVVLLSYGYWMRRFGGDPRVIGRTLTTDPTPRQIVGVMPRGFTIAGAAVDVIAPVRLDRRKATLPGFSWEGVARLKPGVTIAQADEDIARLVPIWMRSWNGPVGVDPLVYTSWRITPAFRPLKDDIVGDVRPALWVLMATVGIVLLIACVNVATLVLVRTDERRHELAIRSAIGASRGRILRALAIEALLLTTAAAAIGVLISSLTVRQLITIAPFDLPRVGEIATGAPELLFAAVIALLAAIGIGALPALRRPVLLSALQSSSRSATETGGSQQARTAMIVVQLALAVILLVSSGLMLRSFSALHAVDPGFTDPGEQLTLGASISKTVAASPEGVRELQRALLANLTALPGVQSAAIASLAPMDNVEPDWDVILPEGQQLSSTQIPPLRFFDSVSPGYFRTVGTRILAGRDFTWSDLEARRTVVVVSENLAKEYWGSAGGAIGRRIQTLPAAPWHTVIGVAQDVRMNGVQKPAPAMVYWPSYAEKYQAGAPFVDRNFTLMVRTSQTSSEELLPEIRRAAAAVNPHIVFASVRSLQEIYTGSMARTSFTMVTLLVAGTMALALGIIGVYGVVAYSVSRRRREIGIRLALGGVPRVLVQAFVTWALGLAAIALPLGLVIALGLTRLMRSLLFGVSPLDPTTYGAVAIVLALAVAAASYFPARRIATIDPMMALNRE